jgi:hypothetical protein
MHLMYHSRGYQLQNRIKSANPHPLKASDQQHNTHNKEHHQPLTIKAITVG